MIDFANFNISIMHISNRFVIVSNIQIIIRMLKYRSQYYKSEYGAT